MRIRRQGHTILGTASSMPSTLPPPQLWVVPSTELPEAVLVCKLNQSPWDVFTYPSTPPRPDPEERPSYSKEDMETMERDGSAAKKTGEKEKKKVSIDENDTGGSRAVGATSICKKTDGKKWKCKQSAAYPGSFCHYHLAQLQSYSYTGSNNNVKAPATTRNKRAAMAAVSLGSDMNDFYYYSVFGPWRGKRRGSANNDISSTTEAKEKDEKAELKDELVTWEFDNMDDSTDEEDKGRRRKLVKARSLKSLF